MKNKKIFLVLFTFLFAFVLVGCKQTFKVQLDNINCLTENIDLNKVRKNQVLELEVNKKDNTILDKVYANDEDITASVVNNQFSYEIVKNTTIKATLKNLYQVSLLGGVELENKDIDLQAVEEGSKLDFIVPAKEGYTPQSLLINDKENINLIKDSKFSLTIKENTIIRLSYIKDDVLVKVSLDGLSLSDNEINKDIDLENVKVGTSLEFIIPQKEGFQLTSLLINNEENFSLIKDNKFIYKVTKNLNIQAVYTKLHNVKLENVKLDTDHTLTEFKALNNSEHTFYIPTKEGYRLASLLINDEEKITLVANDKFKYTITKDTAIKATFIETTKPIKLTLKDVELVDKTIDTTKLVVGNKIEFQIPKKEGYKLTSLLIDNNENINLVKDYKFSYTLLKDHTITALYTKTYKLSFTDVELETKGIQNDAVLDKTSLTFSLIKKENKKIISVLVNGINHLDKVKDNKLTIEITSNTTISVLYEDLVFHKLNLTNVSITTENINPNKVLDKTVVEFEITPAPEQHIFKNLLVNGIDQTSLIKNNKFSLTVDKDLDINAVNRELKICKLNLSGVALADPNLDINTIRENDTIEFRLIDLKNKTSNLEINGSSENLPTISNNKFSLTIKDDITITNKYKLVTPSIYYQDELVADDEILGSDSEASIYEQEATTLEYKNFEPTKIEVVSDQETLDYSVNTNDKTITINKFSKVGNHKLTLTFYNSDDEYITKEINYTITKNQLYHDRLAIDTLYNAYKTIDGKKDLFVNDDFDTVDNYLKFVAPYGAKITQYLDYLDYIRKGDLLKGEMGTYISAPLIGEKYVPELLMNLLNSNENAIKDGTILYEGLFTKVTAKFFDYSAWQELSKDKRDLLKETYDEMMTHYNVIKDFIKAIIDFKIEYDKNNQAKPLKAVLAQLPTYLTYFQEIKNKKGQFDFLNEIKKIKTKFEEQDFKSNKDYLNYLEAKENEDFKNLKDQVLNDGKTNPRETISQIDTTNINQIAEVLLKFLEEFFNKVLPLNAQKTAVDLDTANKYTEAIIHFEYYLVHYFNLLFKNEHILTTDAFKHKSSIVYDQMHDKLKPRELINQLYTKMFGCQEKPKVYRPVKPDSYYGNAKKEYDEAMQKYREEIAKQEYKDKLAAWDATNPYAKGDELVKTLNSFRAQSNIDLVKSIVKPFVENLPKVIKKDEKNNFTLITSLKQRNEFIESLK